MRVGLLALGGCAAPPLWADVVVDAPGSDPALPFGDPALAANGAYGEGCCAGGLDVYAVSPALGRTHLTLAFSAGRVLDGPGPDLVVFENPFDVASGGRFMDPAIVEVSSDGRTFVAFPHAYVGPPDTWTADPSDWEGFAGIEPVAYTEEEPSDPLDPASGGDRFDLADLPGSEGEQVRSAGVLQVRVRPAPEGLPRDPVSDGPDVDGVYALRFSR